ncbi:MarP family serine protease [Conexibacter sp. SYSU D00693]|uniref:MarP family serine protease n=1 Tax=Conexibacter sp. SYSU D00693 TaxID=2812560 RepID=UPI00196B9064|nr:MarP family serine protease [Conexibacter sp. SYSU D00693]
MTVVDWSIVAFAAILAAFGWRQGFVVGALSLGGFALGAWLGTRLAPAVLSEGSASPYAPLFGLLGALLGGAILATGLEGLGAALRSMIVVPGLRALDGLLGAGLAAALALALAWLFGAVALHTPGARDLRREVQRSEVLARLNDLLPPSGPLLNALARFDPFPRLDGPQADVAPPRAAIARDPEVAGAAASVVRVLGTACGLGVSGSGWVAAPGVVVTNAHVVAGQDDTTVQLRGRGEHLDADAVLFDPRNDIAVLRVDGLDAPALEVAQDPPVGRAAAILGFPRNGPYDVRAGRLGRTTDVLTEDAYGRGPLRRRITALRGLVRPGNSGGPMVDGAGRVVTTIFAASRGSDRTGGYGVPDDLVRDALRERSSQPVGTGPCAQ